MHELHVGDGNHGVTVLAAPLRKLPALKQLFLGNTELGDEGVASLVADLGKDDFKALDTLYLSQTSDELTDKGYATLASALTKGAMPRLDDLSVHLEKQAAFNLLLQQRRQ